MYNLCKVNERSLLVDRPTDRRTAAEQYVLPSSKEIIKMPCPIFYENKICITENNNGNVNDYFQQL